MRINKYIAAAGIASRRGADELIAAGKVKVNGAVLTQPGYGVKEGDSVVVNGRPVGAAEKLVYYVLNKPAGYITSARDEFGRPTVLNLLEDVEERVFPVGRLDYDTMGLIIITNDGALGNHIAHPSGEVYKTYLARVNGHLSPRELQKLRDGVYIDGRRTAPAFAENAGTDGSCSMVEIKIREGRNRQVRKMFEAIGYKVLALKRTAIGEIRLGRLKEGSYRKLSAEEIEYLKNC